jgi:hypothetical protein
MISDDLVQAAIITKLQADTTLIAWLTARSAASEIRENQWQGVTFVYPAVRVDLLPQTEPGNPPCYSQQLFNVFVFAEGDSSQNCAILAGLIDSALIRKQMVGTGFSTGHIITLGAIPPLRTAERIWQATRQYQMNLYGGTF